MLCSVFVLRIWFENHTTYSALLCSALLCSALLYEILVELKYLSHIHILPYYWCKFRQSFMLAIQLKWNSTCFRMSIKWWMGAANENRPTLCSKCTNWKRYFIFVQCNQNDKDGVLALYHHEILVFRLGICAYNIVYVLLSTNNESPYSIPFSNVVQCNSM